MFQCHVCGSTKAYEDFVDEVFLIDNKHFLVERIPALVCERCGEKTFSRETTERIRRMIHGDSKPVKSVSIDVFAYA
ncbi:YgiT-type zinc finger protein [candidate division KSB1 bacterium]|nr:YgiT-type zinc finger protein [candidate division KSB1 bacterium]